MFPIVEPPRITEIQVRIDCKGCVQKIKKALHGFNGIYDIYIDLPQQKLTIIGWVDPEKIIKAIRKTRKTASICSHFELQNQQPGQPIEQPPNLDGGGPPPPQDGSGPPPSCGGIPPPPLEQLHPPQLEQPRDYQHRHCQQQQPSEPPRDQASPQQHLPNHEPSHKHPQPQVVEEVRVIHHYTPGYGPSHDPRKMGHNQGHDPCYNPGPSGQYSQGHRAQPQPQTVEEVHVIQHHAPGYGPVHDSRTVGHSQRYSPSYNPEPSDHYSLPQPFQVNHYHQYMPPSYLTQYEYASLSQPSFSSSSYARMDNCYNNNEDYHTYTHNNNNGYDRSMFNKENPNVCTIS